MWIDTHCHLDAAPFTPDRDRVRAQARAAGVVHCVLPAVARSNWHSVCTLAQRHGDSYALGIHPLYTAQAYPPDLEHLQAALDTARHDPHLVALGEIGLDGWAPGLDWARQQQYYRAQLQLARRYALPVLLHVRRSVDAILQGLRTTPVPGGIAHAFNGSLPQARTLLAMGFKLGFGGALTFERAQHLRRLAAALPPEAIVLETDAPDMPPQWLYQPAAARAQGQAQERNSPAELPRIATLLASLRNLTVPDWQAQTYANTLAALPRIQMLLKK